MPNSHGKAVFESRDPTHLMASKDGYHTSEYTGIERRTYNRRSGLERRTSVRFDVNGSERRQNPGRRSDDAPTMVW